MAKKSFIWKGPPTAIEVWSEPHGPQAEPIFSGCVATGGAIPVSLPDDNSLVVSWLAFKLIEEVPPAPAKKKETADG